MKIEKRNEQKMLLVRAVWRKVQGAGGADLQNAQLLFF